MDDDAFPNFGNAYTGASPSITPSASWNPALRPDTEPEEPTLEQPAGGDDDDFFDRYQEPTPRKKRLDVSARNDDVEEAAWGSPVQDKRISVEEEVHVTKSTAEPEELGMQPETIVDVEAPISHHDHPVDEETIPASQDEDAAVFDQDQTVEEQAWGLEEHMPEVANEVPPAVTEPASDGVEQADQNAVHEESHRPEEHYDYQGEVTEMENAVDESAEAPLMADEQPTPALGLVSRAPTFETQPNGVQDALDGQIEQIPLEVDEAEPPKIERSFTTNFTEPPHKDRQESITEHGQVVDEDWPAAGDDKTFGDLLDSQQTSEPEPLSDAALSTEQSSDVPVQSQVSDPEWPVSGNDNAFDGIVQETVNEVPQTEEVVGNDKLDAWGTSTDETSFDALLGNQAQAETEAVSSLDLGKDLNTADEQWPGEDADDTFGELIGNQTKESNAAEGLAIENAHVAPGSSAQPIEEDLSAAFAAALDDDDILDDNELDPATLFGDDDDGLLDDDDFLGGSQDDLQIQSQQPSAAGTAYTPNTMQHAFQQPTISTPGTPFIEQNMSRSGGTPSTGLFDVHDQAGSAQAPQRPPISSAQSFVDKAKGGYQSPYDLPMEVVKPRRRGPQTPRETSSQMPAPPPRSSSFQAPPNGSPVPPMPNAPNASMAPPTSASGTPSMPSQMTPKTASGFFEDLPMKPKTLRAKPSMTYVPQAAGAPTPPLPPQAPPMRVATQPPPRPAGPPTPVQHPTVPGGLTQPGKTPLFSDQPSPPESDTRPTLPNPAPNGRYSPSHTANAAPAAVRYSPAPASSAQVPSAKTRYSPAPTAQSQAQHQPEKRNSSAPQPTGPSARQ